MDAQSFLFAHRRRWPISRKKADCAAMRSPDTDHCELWRLIDLNTKAELAAVELNSALNVFHAKRQTLESDLLHATLPLCAPISTYPIYIFASSRHLFRHSDTIFQPLSP